jgi:hypothetical protein
MVGDEPIDAFFAVAPSRSVGFIRSKEMFPQRKSSPLIFFIEIAGG